MLQGYRPNQFAGLSNIYSANSIITAMVVYSTAAGTGGPLLWNGTNTGGTGTAKGVSAYILGVSLSLSTASTVAGAFGITGGTGQTAAPTATTAITTKANLNLGGAAPQCSVYNVGTVSAAGSFFLPLGQVNTGAITVDTVGVGLINLGGCIIVPPGGWCAVSADATLTTSVMDVGLVWFEIAND